jgi:hypothetical protein
MIVAPALGASCAAPMAEGVIPRSFQVAGRRPRVVAEELILPLMCRDPGSAQCELATRLVKQAIPKVCSKC